MNDGQQNVIVVMPQAAGIAADTVSGPSTMP
jgi:hypothetical protein